MDQEDRDFHQRRAEQELEQASRATDEQASKAHSDLAELHLQRSRVMKPKLSISWPSGT